MKTLSQDAVRGLMIAAQGLDEAPSASEFPDATKEDVRAIIRRINMLQIDSISVVARAPYFVLWSRLGDYDPNWLDALLEETIVFEHYANATCFLPIEDYPLFLTGSRIFDWRNPRKWLAENSEVASRVMRHVRLHGETRHTDFVRTDGEKTTWENPKQEQTALLYLSYVGELMVRRRDKFQPVYDLTERVYPEAENLPEVPREDAHDQLMLHSIRAMGVAKPEWVGDYYRLKAADAKAALKRLEKANRVVQVAVEGWKTPGYVHPDNLNLVEAAAAGAIPQSKTTLLSPFDPLVWSRGRTLEMFDFDHFIEFYKPEPNRIYGYYSLPILYNNALIGRLDPKAYRDEGVFEVRSLHLERGVVVDEAMFVALKSTLKACAAWHKTPHVIVHEAAEPGLAELLSD